MQCYPEREERLIALFDSSRDDMERICTGLADTFIKLYKRCEKGEEKYGHAPDF